MLLSTTESPPALKPDPNLNLDQNLDLDSTVRSLYRAATAETPWEPVLDTLCAGLGARALTLQTIDVRDGCLLDLHQGGSALAESTLDYLRQWHQVDPQRAHTLSSAQAQHTGWTHSDEWFDERIAVRQPFFRHFLPGRGSLHSSHLAVSVGPKLVTGFAVEWPRHRTAPDAVERHWLERLGQHLRDARARARAPAPADAAGLGWTTPAETAPASTWVAE